MTMLDENDWTGENSCLKVRDSCRSWITSQEEGKECVQIQPSALAALAKDILAKHQSTSSSSSPIAIEWDEEKWHYLPSSRLPPKIAFERLALYILAVDAINFCFWPSHSSHKDAVNFEYNHLVMAMACMAQEDEAAQIANPSCLSDDYVFSPARLAHMTVEEMNALWDTNLAKLSDSDDTSNNPRKISGLDNMSTRCKLWNEIGQVLLDQWNGSIMNFLDIQEEDHRCGLSAPLLVDRMVQSFPGFRDCCAWPTSSHRYLYLYKRAQICVGDLNASLKLNLTDLDQVTTFADYRVPQLLRHVGVLQYEPSLGDRIDRGEEIPKGSLEEQTIRAATVVAVEDLVQELHKQQKQQLEEGNGSSTEIKPTIFTAVSVDWYLWQVGEKLHNEGTLKPHHKTRTTFY